MSTLIGAQYRVRLGAETWTTGAIPPQSDFHPHATEMTRKTFKPESTHDLLSDAVQRLFAVRHTVHQDVALALLKRAAAREMGLPGVWRFPDYRAECEKSRREAAAAVRGHAAK